MTTTTPLTTDERRALIRRATAVGIRAAGARLEYPLVRQDGADYEYSWAALARLVDRAERRNGGAA